ncbi:MAG: MlaD family protein [Candidatus Omnitrophota bacterium]|nr:MCE family protein [Candidatus Omnitrophota bacterium]
MEFGKTRVEYKIGFFVFTGLIILVIFILMIGDLKHAFSKHKINFIFNFVNGVKIGAPVRYAGLDIGEIRDMKLITSEDGKSTLVKLEGWVKQEIKIPIDSQVWVNTLGLLGEKYVEIMPGKDTKRFVGYNGKMTGNDPFAMQEFGELGRSIAIKLDNVLTEVQDLARSFDEGITRVKNKEGTVGKLLYQDEIYNDLRDMVQDLKKHPWKLFWKTK